jgi:hypothetical protein
MGIAIAISRLTQVRPPHVFLIPGRHSDWLVGLRSCQCRARQRRVCAEVDAPCLSFAGAGSTIPSCSRGSEELPGGVTLMERH